MWIRYLEAEVGQAKVRFVITSDGVNEPEVTAFTRSGEDWTPLAFTDETVDEDTDL